MKIILVVVIATTLGMIASVGYGASARCVVLEKNGNVLVMDCGERAKDFQEKTKVKIKTDRGKR